jgi:hypothetical protein
MKGINTFFQEGLSFPESFIAAFKNAYPDRVGTGFERFRNVQFEGARIFLSEESEAEIRKSKPDQIEVWIVDAKSDVSSGYLLALDPS